MERTGGLTIRDAREADWGEVLRMNEADVEVLSPLDREMLARLADCAEAFWVAEDAGTVASFMVAMREGCGYWGENYRWFDDERPDANTYRVSVCPVQHAHLPHLPQAGRIVPTGGDHDDGIADCSVPRVVTHPSSRARGVRRSP